MQKFVASLISFFLLFGCASQAPAPIEFKSHSNVIKSSKIKSRDINLTDDSILAEEVKRNKIEDKDDEPFVTTRKVEYGNDAKEEDNKSKSIYDLEKEMDALAYQDNDSHQEAKDVGQVISPTRNPHHVPVVEKLSFISPIDGQIISKFGEVYMGKKNSGVNILAPVGSDIKAVSDGAVIFAGEDPKFGNLIVIKHNKGDMFSAYAHMNDIILKEKSLVKSGQVVGHVGKTGDITKPQLHFAMRQGKMPVDPLKYIKQSD